MSSTQLTPLGMTDESLKELLLDLIPGDGHDYTANFLWKDELEFQEVLYYWSSRFRAIHLAKLLTPVAEEFKSSWELYYAAEVGFMVASIGMAAAQDHFSCLRGEPLHPQEQICRDSIRTGYDFPWWITQLTYPREGASGLLKTSVNWYKWVEGGALPRRQADLETSMLSQADIQQVVSQLEEARELLLQRIAHAEAEEADVTEQIATWENMVYKSATLDLAQHRINRM